MLFQNEIFTSFNTLYYTKFDRADKNFVIYIDESNLIGVSD